MTPISRMAVLAGLLSCSPARSAPVASLPVGDAESAHMLTDCPWVATGCTPEEDGCSEVEGHATVSPAWTALAASKTCGDALIAQVAADVAGQLSQKPALERARIVAPSAACRDAIVATMSASGVPTPKIEAVIDPEQRWVRFEVAAWDGARCQ